MGETHQDRWLDVLPFVLLGRRVAFQPDMGASASEMTFGKNVSIPGEILHDPESEEGLEASKKLLNLVRSSTDRQIHQPSSHAKPETPLPGLPEEVKRVFTKQHQTTGLDPSYEGPFNIAERPTKSVVKLNVGSYKDGRVRYEFRHLNDIKPAHPKSLAGTVERPKLGRPAAMTSTSSSAKAPGSTESEAAFQVQNGGKINKPAAAPPTHAEEPPNSNVPVDHEGNEVSPDWSPRPSPSNCNYGPVITKDMLDKWGEVVQPSSRPVRSTRNPNPIYMDAISTETAQGFSGPPPFRGFPELRTWSASRSDLDSINQSINTRQV